MTENIAGAYLYSLHIEFNLRQNVQFYRFRTFWCGESKTHQNCSFDAIRSMRFRSQRKRISLKTHECEQGLRLVSCFLLFFLPIIVAVTTKSLDVCNSTFHCTVSWSTHVLVRFLVARVVWLDEKLCFTLPIYTKVYKSTFPLFSTLSTSSLKLPSRPLPTPPKQCGVTAQDAYGKRSQTSQL